MSMKHCPQCGAALEPQACYCRVCGAPVQTAREQKTSRSPSRRQTLPIPILLLAGGGLLLLVGALFSLLGRPTPAVAPSANVASIPDNHDESGLPYPEVARIPLEQAKANYERGTAVIVDVRNGEEYAEAHIPGAISIPLNELETRYEELSKGNEIITYCAWPSEESSARAAFILMELGYTNVKALQGGFRAWQEAGYALTSGS